MPARAADESPADEPLAAEAPAEAPAPEAPAEDAGTRLMLYGPGADETTRVAAESPCHCTSTLT